MAKNRKKEVVQPHKKKKGKETPPVQADAQPKSKWQEFIHKHAVSKQQ